MKLTIKSDYLLDRLPKLIKTKRKNVPKDMRIIADADNNLTFAYNQEQLTLPADVEEPGDLLINKFSFEKIFPGFTANEDIKIEIEGKQLVIKQRNFKIHLDYRSDNADTGYLDSLTASRIELLKQERARLQKRMNAINKEISGRGCRVKKRIPKDYDDIL